MKKLCVCVCACVRACVCVCVCDIRTEEGQKRRRTTFHCCKKWYLVIELFFATNLEVNHLQPWIQRRVTVGEDMNTFERTIGNMKLFGEF